jgi:hypothetical protein
MPCEERILRFIASSGVTFAARTQHDVKGLSQQRHRTQLGATEADAAATGRVRPNVRTGSRPF